MALNFPGPYEVRINYTTAGMEHQLRLSFNAPDPGISPGANYATINALQKNSTSGLLSTHVQSYVDAIKPFLSAADTTIDNVEVWKYTPQTFQAQFLSSGVIGQAGTSVSSHVPAGQMFMTFRSTEGGILKATIMQGTTQPGEPILPADFSANLILWETEFTKATSIWIARDTSYIASVRKFLPGQSETLFKRIYRS